MDSSEKKEFSLKKRISSSNHAWRGIGILFRGGHNIWIATFCALCVIYLGFALHISGAEWTIIILTIGGIFCLEAVNTAIEIDIDLTSPEYHPYARDTKDVAAGAVLLAVLFAGVIGMIIFFPKVFALFQ